MPPVPARLALVAVMIAASGVLAPAPAPAQAPLPAAAEPPPPGAENLPNRPGKDQIILSCSGCHQPDIVLGQKRDAAAWRELVDMMIARGANVEEGKYEEIIAYLAQNG